MLDFILNDIRHKERATKSSFLLWRTFFCPRWCTRLIYLRLSYSVRGPLLEALISGIGDGSYVWGIATFPQLLPPYAGEIPRCNGRAEKFGMKSEFDANSVDPEVEEIEQP